VLGRFTIPYGISQEVIVFKKENTINVNRPEDLYGKTVGIVRGYSYPKFDNAFKEERIHKANNRSEKLLLKQLQADRVKYIFIGYRTIKYYIKQNPQYKDIIIGDVVSKVNVKLRVHPNKSYLINELNVAIEKLISTGKINDIYQKYQ
jgi:polar amino acid transport system substrate-binding protein